MDAKTLDIVRESWALVQKEVPNWADIFYAKMLSNPEVVHLFSFANAEDFTASESYKAHAARVGSIMNTAMKSIDKFDKLVPTLKALGARHVNYNVNLTHTHLFTECFLHTLKTGYGDAWNQELEEAWSKLLVALLAPYDEGLAEAIEKAEAAPAESQ
eukprot:m.109015 g.109015  ORF g.109015 m.109015 type:complete len:158 (+) comp15230_c0_seq1:294-767(+)